MRRPPPTSRSICRQSHMPPLRARHGGAPPSNSCPGRPYRQSKGQGAVWKPSTRRAPLGTPPSASPRYSWPTSHNPHPTCPHRSRRVTAASRTAARAGFLSGLQSYRCRWQGSTLSRCGQKCLWRAAPIRFQSSAMQKRQARWCPNTYLAPGSDFQR
eukprot:29176_1